MKANFSLFSTFQERADLKQVWCSQAARFTGKPIGVTFQAGKKPNNFEGEGR
ncbi:hypothetical protein [Mesorhizobium metallidurans]|uniref:hypothetical protein n=1 Tax=Mesorhizobium metallidurans TaxID=489722 RepID=UPI0012FC63C3|nr:hypothetical protein [Mesorhizobium metallidurans]